MESAEQLVACAVLLLVSGDIHPNPGPSPNQNFISPCSVCPLPVRNDQDGLYCEVCLSWAHRVCVGMSLDVYFHWGQIDDGWVCPKCEEEALPFRDTSSMSLSMCSSESISSSSLESSTPRAPHLLSVFSFNARSLLPKIDDLRAICSNENYDLVIITETWLSANILDHEICVPGYSLVRRDRNRHGGGVALNPTCPLKFYSAFTLTLNCYCWSAQSTLGSILLVAFIAPQMFLIVT